MTLQEAIEKQYEAGPKGRLWLLEPFICADSKRPFFPEKFEPAESVQVKYENRKIKIGINNKVFYDEEAVPILVQWARENGCYERVYNRLCQEVEKMKQIAREDLGL